jgi:hypothetical protein
MAIRGELQKVKKLDKPALVFFNEIKELADTLASIGQPLRPDEFSGFLCAGLNGEYDALVQMVSARALTDPMPIREIYAQLLATEQCLEARRAELATDVHMANVNYRARGGGFPPPPQFSPPPAYPKPSPPPSNNNNQRGQGTSAPCGGGGSSSGGSRPVCEICGKIGHVASCCFKRYDPNFLGSGNDGRYKDKQLAAFHTPTANNTNYGATPSYPIDPNWYADMAATDHFTNDLDKLTMKEHDTAPPTLDVTDAAVFAMEEISSHHNKEKELKVDVYRFYGKSGMQTIDPMRMQAKHSDYMVAPSGLGLHLYGRENSGWRYFYVGDKLIKVEDLIADCAWFKRRCHVSLFIPSLQGTATDT